MHRYRHTLLLLSALGAAALLAGAAGAKPASDGPPQDGGAVAHARGDDQHGHDDKRDKRDNRDEEENADPCRQLIDGTGDAEDLARRCEVQGTGAGAAKGDFNGDGIADLAVGVPHEDEAGAANAGAVNIIYGSSAGLTGTGSRFLTAAAFGYTPATGDHFGSALAAGNFNGDKYSDLAIGMPDRAVGNEPNAGRVVLIDGSENGLDNSSARTLPLLTDAQSREKAGRAGAALVWGKFNGDDYADLAVGIPEAGLLRPSFTCFATFSVLTAGEVQVFYGGPIGVTPTGGQRLHESMAGVGFDCEGGLWVGGSARQGDGFGSVLAAGNFRYQSAIADLVVGVPAEDLDLTRPDAGMVYLFPGSSTGLRPYDGQVLSQDTPGVGGGAEAGDQFGRTLATGDFDSDLRDDLAVGIPLEDLVNNTRADAGAVQVFFGNTFDNANLVDPESDLFISQASLPGISVESGALFGWSLAVGRFNGADAFEDLAVGSPGQSINGVGAAGIVDVLYGSLSGPSFSNVQIWHQDSTGILDAAESGDNFGYALSAWNYGKDTNTDLAIGVPGEGINGHEDAGAAHVLYGSPSGLLAGGNQFWHQDVAGIGSGTQPDELFGRVLY